MFTITLTVSANPDGSLGLSENVAVAPGQTVTRGDVADLLLQRAAEHNKARKQRVPTVPEVEAMRAAKAAESAKVSESEA